jgi:hypothetical protein
MEIVIFQTYPLSSSFSIDFGLIQIYCNVVCITLGRNVGC